MSSREWHTLWVHRQVHASGLHVMQVKLCHPMALSPWYTWDCCWHGIL